MKRSFSKTIALTGTTPKELLDRRFETVTVKVTGAGTIKVNGGDAITMASGDTLTFTSNEPITSVVATPAAASGFTSILLTGLCDKIMEAPAAIAPVKNPFQIPDPIAMPKMVYDTSDGSAVLITCATPGATIYYATSAKTALADYTEYTMPVDVAPTEAVQILTYYAYAKKAGLDDSAVTSFTFEVAASTAGV